MVGLISHSRGWCGQVQFLTNETKGEIYWDISLERCPPLGLTPLSPLAIVELGAYDQKENLPESEVNTPRLAEQKEEKELCFWWHAEPLD